MTELYNSLKIIHILSGSLVFCTILGSQFYWLYWTYQPQAATLSAPFAHKMGQKTLPIIVLGAFTQILTGFTLISLHHITWQTLWVKVAFIGIISLLALWGLFMLMVTQPRQRARYLAPIVCFSSASVLMTMIYFMANVNSPTT